MEVKINISLKDGVLDPQAKAIYNALHSLNFTEVKNVYFNKQIKLNIDIDDEKKAYERVQSMCEELLANTVIEDYEIII